MKKLYKFKNGLKLVYERLPYVRSVAVGVFVNTGSGNETAENNGISHFIEHMLFKGTATKSAFEIAESMEKSAPISTPTPQKPTLVFTRFPSTKTLKSARSCCRTCTLIRFFQRKKWPEKRASFLKKST